MRVLLSRVAACRLYRQGDNVTTTDRAAFFAERSTGIGGSDIHHLFSLPPYGCALKLWREKSGQPPDYPRDESGPMRRGNALEPIIADEYARTTGRRVETRGVIRDPDHPELLVHVDRVVQYGSMPPGVLEIKSVGRDMLAKLKREGMPDAYILQLQHGMLCTGYTWGSFAVHCADNWQLIWWDVARDEDIIADIRREGQEFWRRVQAGDPPEALPAGDKRCQRCEYRTSCHGQALLALCAGDGGDVEQDPAIAGVVAEYVEARDIAEEADALVSAARERLEAALGDRTAVDTPGARVYWRPQTSMRWDTKALERAHPELVAKFKRPSVSRPLRVYPR